MSSPSSSQSRKRMEEPQTPRGVVVLLVVAKLLLALVAFFGGKELGYVQGVDYTLANQVPDRAWFDCKSFDNDRYNWSHQLGIPHGNPISGEGM